MQTLELWVGSPRLSSWSLRPDRALRPAGAPCSARGIPLVPPQTKARVAERSPSGRAPVLRDGKLSEGRSPPPFSDTVWALPAVQERRARATGEG